MGLLGRGIENGNILVILVVHHHIQTDRHWCCQCPVDDQFKLKESFRIVISLVNADPAEVSTTWVVRSCCCTCWTRLDAARAARGLKYYAQRLLYRCKICIFCSCNSACWTRLDTARATRGLKYYAQRLLYRCKICIFCSSNSARWRRLDAAW